MTKKVVLFAALSLLLILVVAGCGAKQEAKSEKPAETGATAATYVGSQKCAGCHADIAEKYGTTMHTKMSQDAKANPAVIIGDFTKPGNPFEVAANFKQEDIIYTIGSKWKQRYVVKDGENLRVLPAEWIVKDQKWQPYHDKDWDQRDWGDLCIACHTTGYDAKTKKWVDNGITCEACHGPGSKHIAQASKDNIINPAKLTPKQQVEVCGQCHVRGPEPKVGEPGREDALGYIPGGEFAKFMKPLAPTPEELAKEKSAFYKDGASKKHHQQYNDFVQSKHYANNMSCITCHSSHNADIPGQLKDTVDKLCFSCHNEGGKAETKLDKPLDINKYMPKRAKSATPGDITTHTWIPDQTFNLPQ